MDPIALKLSYVLLAYMFIAHWLSCTFYYIARSSEYRETWITACIQNTFCYPEFIAEADLGEGWRALRNGTGIYFFKSDDWYIHV